MEQFRYEKLSERLIRIIDPCDVACYLVLGDTQAALLDTGSGIGSLKSYVKQFTNLPIVVFLTHGHLDHIGGAGEFTEVYLPKVEMPVYIKHSDMKYRVDTTSEFLHRTVNENELMPIYDRVLKDMSDGQVFDLGNLHIKMVQVPGHTPGIVCPLIEEERAIIFGDACGVGVLLFDEYSSTVSAYRKSLLHLKDFEKDYDTVLRNHGTFYSEKSLLDNVIACCDLILSGKDAKQPVVSHGAKLFSASQLAADNHTRLDGKQGNIFYSLDKAI